MRKRMCNACKEWSPTADWGAGCPQCGHDNTRKISQQIMKDIKPYLSMVDGSEITSRSRHREHLRDHGYIEVGNDSSLSKPRKPLESPPGLKDAIIRAVNQVERKQRCL